MKRTTTKPIPPQMQPKPPPPTPTRCADAARDVCSCSFSTSPSGIGCPSVSIATVRSAFVIASRYVTVPFAKPKLSSRTFHGDGCDDCLNWKVHVLRPSARRSRSTAGFTTSIDGMTISCASSGRIARSKCAASSVTNLGVFAQSGLPISSCVAEKLGQGTQARQPVSPSGRRQPTLRSPLIANGRPSAALTCSLTHGFARFQSNVKRKTPAAAMSTATIPTIHAADLPMARVSVMAVPLLF